MPEQAVSLLPLHWTQLAAAEQIEQEVFPADAWNQEMLWSELAGVPDRRFYLAARRGDELVGYAGLALAGHEGEIATVAVAANAQRTGLGRRLMTALLDEARERKMTRVHLEVRVDNGPAIALYRSLGFTEGGRRTRYYADGVDALTMVLELAQ